MVAVRDTCEAFVDDMPNTRPSRIWDYNSVQNQMKDKLKLIEQCNDAQNRRLNVVAIGCCKDVLW
jgi:hypothetical protein